MNSAHVVHNCFIHEALNCREVGMRAILSSSAMSVGLFIEPGPSVPERS
jgi:hypothetical protein